MFSGLSSTGSYFNQVLSLSSSPINSFTTTNWDNLIDLIMWLLTNPFFYWIVGIILILNILPTVEDE